MRLNSHFAGISSLLSSSLEPLFMIVVVGVNDVAPSFLSWGIGGGCVVVSMLAGSPLICNEVSEGLEALFF